MGCHLRLVGPGLPWSPQHTLQSCQMSLGLLSSSIGAASTLLHVSIASPAFSFLGKCLDRNCPGDISAMLAAKKVMATPLQ